MASVMGSEVLLSGRQTKPRYPIQLGGVGVEFVPDEEVFPEGVWLRGVRLESVAWKVEENTVPKQNRAEEPQEVFLEYAIGVAEVQELQVFIKGSYWNRTGFTCVGKAEDQRVL